MDPGIIGVIGASYAQKLVAARVQSAIYSTTKPTFSDEVTVVDKFYMTSDAPQITIDPSFVNLSGIYYPELNNQFTIVQINRMVIDYDWLSSSSSPIEIVLTHPPYSPPAPNGAPGAPGARGADGYQDASGAGTRGQPGQPGGQGGAGATRQYKKVVLIVKSITDPIGRIVPEGKVNFRFIFEGQNGGSGGNGGAGGAGGNGGPGLDGASGALDCRRGPNNGGDGGIGGVGGLGGNGGDAGYGANVVVFGDTHRKATLDKFLGNLNPGQPGLGGYVSQVCGAGGRGGARGSAPGWCTVGGAHDGAPGQTPLPIPPSQGNGQPGRKGFAGNYTNYALRPISGAGTMAYAVELAPDEVVQNIRLLSVTRDGATVDWDDGSSGSAAVTIELWNDATSNWIKVGQTPRGAFEYTFSGLKEGTLYLARISAVSSSGNPSAQQLSFTTAGTASSLSYVLTLTKTGTGSGTVTSSPAGINCGTACSANFTGNVTLTAEATTGSTFAGWGGDCSGTATSCTVSMTAAKNVTAAFSATTFLQPPTGVTASDGAYPDRVRVTWNSVANAGVYGVYRRDADGSNDAYVCNGCTANFAFDDTSISIGKIYQYWVIACNTSQSQCGSWSASDSGYAGASTYALTVTKTGSGTGTVSGGGNYAAGATVNLTAVAATGSTFAGWSPSPCASGFVMPANNLNCTATFNRINQTFGAAVGVFRNGQWFLDANGNGAWDGCGTEFCFSGFGQAGDRPASGNWDGGSKSYIGVLRSGTGQWFIDRNGNRQWDGCTVDGCYSGFGAPGDLPVAGDWNGTGFAKIGVFRNGQWFLDNGNGAWNGCGTELCLSFGQAGDLPVAGNWDGGLKAGVGVFRAGTWYLDFNGNGAWDGCGTDRCYFNSFGQAGDFPAAGDWNGDGKAKVGVFRNSTWYLDYNGNGVWDGCQQDGGQDKCLFNSFGQAGDLPVAGKW